MTRPNSLEAPLRGASRGACVADTCNLEVFGKVRARENNVSVGNAAYNACLLGPSTGERRLDRCRCEAERGTASRRERNWLRGDGDRYRCGLGLSLDWLATLGEALLCNGGEGRTRELNGRSRPTVAATNLKRIGSTDNASLNVFEVCSQGGSAEQSDAVEKLEHHHGFGAVDKNGWREGEDARINCPSRQI